MGLRCLFAHDFGSTEVERERQEDGNEMVVTVREVQSCERCGERKVLSENKEVTAIRTPEELGIDRPTGSTGNSGSATTGAPHEEPRGPTAGTAPSQSGTAEAENRAAADSAVDDGGDPSTTVAAESTAPGAEPTVTENATTAPTDDGPASGPSADPDAEDTEILEERDAERGYGEWPDPGTDSATASDATGPTERTEPAEVDRSGADAAGVTEEPAGVVDGERGPEDDAESVDPETLAAEEDAEFIGGPSTTADEGGTDAESEPAGDASAAESDSGGGSGWPDHDGEDEGFSAGAATDQGPGVSFGGGLTPQVSSENTGTSANGETLSANGGAYETSFVEAEHENRDGDGNILSAPGEDEGAAPAPDVETEFFCPSCEHTRPTDASLRPGDICPECQRGYIAERER